MLLKKKKKATFMYKPESKCIFELILPMNSNSITAPPTLKSHWTVVPLHMNIKQANMDKKTSLIYGT